MKNIRIALRSITMALLVTLSFSAKPALAEDGSSDQPTYPMLDGRCKDVAALGEVHVLPHGLKLHIFQDPGYVWLCIPLGEEDYGVLDLYLETPDLPAPLNLHVSAQLGEWRADDPDGAPKTSNSPDWWQTEGWVANTVRFNGQIEGGSRVNFQRTPGREVQLSKARFGRGQWKIQLNLTGIAASSQPVLFPPNEDKKRRTFDFQAN